MAQQMERTSSQRANEPNVFETGLEQRDRAEIVGFTSASHHGRPNRNTPALLSGMATTLAVSALFIAEENWISFTNRLSVFKKQILNVLMVKRLEESFRGLSVFKLLNRRRTAFTLILASIVAYYSLKNKGNKNRKCRCRRVAVIGSGIAGTGAAWLLRRSGIDAVIYEKKPKLGGNAKSFTWNFNGKKVTTGLAVLAWPEKLFNCYNCLIKEMNMETEEHDLKFFVSERLPNGSHKCVFAHGKNDWKPEPWLENDLKQWERLTGFVRWINSILQPSKYPSMYRMSFLNPLNLIPLRTLCRLFGISNRFWDFVFVPIHSSTFLETEMGGVPSVMAEVLDDIVPFTQTPKMLAWKTQANDVMYKMTQDFPNECVKTSCAVEKVEFIPGKNGNEVAYDILVRDENNDVESFDGIIFACSAVAMNQILHGKQSNPTIKNAVSNPNNGLINANKSILNKLEEEVFSRTMYTEDRDITFQRGTVHSKANAVIPSRFREEVLNAYCNYIEVDSAQPRNLENSFVISSWAPTAQDASIRGKLPMLVSFNAEKKLENEDTEWTVTSREAHPCLTTWQFMASQVLWPVLQGTRNGQAFFCGSAVTPGNGHDLSFLSGLIAATELGATFPFSYDLAATEDYKRLRKMMFSFWR